MVLQKRGEFPPDMVETLDENPVMVWNKRREIFATRTAAVAKKRADEYIDCWGAQQPHIPYKAYLEDDIPTCS